MKIRQIHINGFGVWHDQSWSGLTDGVNVFHGPNEAGKTTLMSFIRSILFGFERRSHPRRYEPQNGGRYGGWLDVQNGRCQVRIERKAGRHVRGRVRVRMSEGISDVVQGDEAMLEDMLGGTTRTVYHNVFAFGLEELEHFRTLEESDVASHISGAGMGVGATRWSRVWKDIEERRSRLFLPRGQNSTLNRALKELDSVREELDQTEGDPEDYVRAHEDLTRIEAETRRLERARSRLEKRLSHYKKLKEVEPHRQRRVAIEEELGRLEPVAQFPEGGVERLNLLLHQSRQLEAEIERQRAETERMRRERIELAAVYTPQELIRSSRTLDSLRLLLPRRDAAEEAVADGEAKRDSIRLERDAVVSRREAARPPSAAGTSVFMALLALAGTGFFLRGYPEAGWSVSAMMPVLTYWYYRRRRSWTRMRGEVQTVDERLQSAEEALERQMEEFRKIAISIERLVGRSDFSQEELQRESRRIQKLTEMAERIRSIDEVLRGEERHFDRIKRQIRDNRQAIEALFREGGAVSESDFFRRSELYLERRRLEEELVRTPSGEVSPDPSMTGLEPLNDATYKRAEADFEELNRRLRETRTESGRLEERIAVLGRSEERSRARLRQQSILARVDEASEKWSVLTLCRALLEDTQRIYENERQPEVLQHAAEFFGRMTGGRWARIIAPLDSTQILVESLDGDRLSPEQLSRGTAEQLYLAMRLALVREYSNHVEALPVILDDIFVNFDPERTRRSVEAIGELSRTHQILLFTCHPHLLNMVEEILPDSQIYPLQ